MSSREQHRKLTLDHMIDEKFAEIFFLAKDEYDIKSNTDEERKLWNLLQRYKLKLKTKCDNHFGDE